MSLKRSLILLIIVMLLIPSPITSKADATSATKGLHQLGLLSNITPAEMNTTLNRIVGLTMILKSLGYKDSDASKSERTLTFKDFGSAMKWGAGWANLGVVNNITTGTSDTSFSPTKKLTKREFLCYQLRALGYGVDESWRNCASLSFQAGLIPSINATTTSLRFTKSEAAEIMYVALNAQMKDGSGITLIEHLISEGIVDEIVAKDLKLPGINKIIIDSVTPLTNSKITVALKKSVNTVNVDDFILKNNFGSIIKINTAILSSDGSSIILSTNDQNSGTVHTLVIKGSSELFSFTALYQDFIRPRLTNILVLTTTKIKIVFSESIDDQAIVSSNYSINGLQVKNATFEKDSEAKDIRTSVILTTSSQSYNTSYKLIVNYLKDLSGNVIDPNNNSLIFLGRISDNTKPKMISALSLNNNIIQLVFSENVDEITAETVANYEVSGLTIIEAVRQINISVVYLTTSEQVGGYIYTIKAKSIIDLENNNLDEAYNTLTFFGKGKDITKPKLISAIALSNTSIRVTFNEPISEDTGHIEYAYYLGSELGNPSKVVEDTTVSDGTVWILTTSPQDSKQYTLDVMGVQDMSGNILDEQVSSVTFMGLLSN